MFRKLYMFRNLWHESLSFEDIALIPTRNTGAASAFRNSHINISIPVSNLTQC